MLKNMLTGINGFKFRKINDAEGECATLLTLIFDTKEKAEKFCDIIGSKPIAYSGWHVYNNMEHILNKATPSKVNCPYSCEKYGVETNYKKHMLPQTDDILDRAVNISIGVVDKGLGSGYGININSQESEIKEVGQKLRNILLSL